MQTVNFIGCGKVGQTLAYLIAHRGATRFKLGGIMSGSTESTQRALAFIGHGTPCKTLSTLPDADIYFITTSDDKIESVCQQLTTETSLKEGSIIVHCSAALSSDVLASARAQGCAIASAHPIASFTDPDSNIRSFDGTCFTLEGDEAAVITLYHLCRQIGGTTVLIKKNHKTRYHIACVMANNYVVSLHYYAVQCFLSAGFNESMAHAFSNQLAQTALRNIENKGYEHALTGPIQRGDTSTVAMHLANLDNNPLLQALYQALGMATLSISPHLPADKARQLATLLTNND